LDAYLQLAPESHRRADALALGRREKRLIVKRPEEGSGNAAYRLRRPPRLCPARGGAPGARPKVRLAPEAKEVPRGTTMDYNTMG